MKSKNNSSTNTVYILSGQDKTFEIFDPPCPQGDEEEESRHQDLVVLRHRLGASGLRRIHVLKRTRGRMPAQIHQWILDQGNAPPSID